MKRRAFLSGLASTTALPVAAQAQRKSGVPTIGLLVPGEPNPEPMLLGLKDQLRELGYVERQNIRFVVRRVRGGPGRAIEAAKDLTSEHVDVIVAWLTPMVLAAKEATASTPIVMAGAANPVETGLVESLVRPGGNVTGLSGQGAELAGKCVELLRECLPSARVLGVLANATDIFTKPMLAQLRDTAQSVTFETHVIERTREDSLDSAFEEFRERRIDALFVQPTLINQAAVASATGGGVPSASFVKVFAELGGLLSYGVEKTEQYRTIAAYVDRILGGSKPAEMPVSQSRRFELVINLKTARQLGVIVPSTLLLRADEVIE